MDTNTNISFGLGGKADLPDERDFKTGSIGGISPMVLPETYSLRSLQTSVKNQQSTNWCGSFAGTAILEYFQNLETGEKQDLDEVYLFQKIKEYDLIDYGYTGLGAYMRSVAKALTKNGTGIETFKFNNQEYLYQTANFIDYQTEKLKTYFQPTTKEIDEIKKHIVKFGVGLCRIEISNEQMNEAKNTGLVIGNFDGFGHFVDIVGWNKTHWELKNSWSEEYGDNGYLWIPIEWVKQLQFYFFTDNIMECVFKDVPSTMAWAFPALNALHTAEMIIGYPSDDGTKLFNKDFQNEIQEEFIRSYVIMAKVLRKAGILNYED
jgi:C1A family cysteine protease